MEYYSKVPISLKPISKRKYLRSTSRYQEYLHVSSHSRNQSDSLRHSFKKSQETSEIYLRSIYDSSIEALPSLSRTFKKVSTLKKPEPKNSLEVMRKLYSPSESRPKDRKESKKEVQDLQRYLQEFHSRSKYLLSQLEESMKKTLS